MKRLKTNVYVHVFILAPINTIHGPVELRRDAAITRKVIEFFNNLFHSSNGSSATQEGDAVYRVNVSENSPHHAFWQYARKFLGQIRYVDRDTRDKKSVPSLENCYFNIRGYEKLWTILKSYGFTEYSPRLINQDFIENLFWCIRQRSPNRKLTCWQVLSALKIYLLEKMGSLSIRHGNVEPTNEEDRAEGIISTFKSFVTHVLTDYDKDNDNTGEDNFLETFKEREIIIPTS